MSPLIDIPFYMLLSFIVGYGTCLAINYPKYKDPEKEFTKKKEAARRRYYRTLVIPESAYIAWRKSIDFKPNFDFEKYKP